MVLVKSEASEQLKATLRKRFYQPRGLVPEITETVPVRGSTLITVPMSS